MDNKEIRKKVEQFRKKFDLKTVDYKGIKNALEKSGYSLIEFNNVYNDKNVASLIDALNLTEFVRTTKCFTYADNNYRLIFVHEDLSESEKLLVLSHEAAHVALGHMLSRPVIGTAIREEYEANEFSHYLLNTSRGDRVIAALGAHKAAVISVAIAILIAVTVIVFLFGGTGKNPENGTDSVKTTEEKQTEEGVIEGSADEETDTEDSSDENVEYYGDFYITPTGTKYHKEECKRIKDKINKIRMTVEDHESGKYEACDICLPDQE